MFFYFFRVLEFIFVWVTFTNEKSINDSTYAAPVKSKRASKSGILVIHSDYILFGKKNVFLLRFNVFLQVIFAFSAHTR